MKTKFILIIPIIIAMISCKKDEPAAPYSCTTCNTTPEAIAANDASSKGIYKGIVVGSSGTIEFDIANNGSTITAKMVIDGTSVTLTSNVTWESGKAYVGAFTGTLNGSAVSITFSVGASGETPTVTSSTIPGHPNAVLQVYKETSTALIECWEGTYNTTEPESGTFNLILSRKLGLWAAVSRASGSSSTNDVDGTISNNQLHYDNNGTDVTIATLNTDELSGSFTDDNGHTVTVKGKRTL